MPRSAPRRKSEPRGPAGNHRERSARCRLTAKPEECMPLPLLTTSSATPCRQRREHNARCITTSKTRNPQSTAIINDERDHFLPAASGIQREVHHDQQNQENANHCHNQRRARPLPAGKRRDSTKCTKTSKTSRMHATAVVDDERGHKEKERQRPQDSSVPNHVENMKFFQSHPQADEEYVSTVKPSVARLATAEIL